MMNEMIEKLAVDANAWFPTGYPNVECGDEFWENLVIFEKKDLEKFAELIVKECCKIIKEEENDALNTFRYMGDSPPGRDYISEIKKHFGIKDE